MSALDPIELRVLGGALRAACDEMGTALIHSAHSSNIKERRDASTALFDPDGQMVMQAEHIPVHLGSMPASVAAVLDEHHQPGVSWVLNDPFAGGTHLPDITVVTPVFDEAGALLGFAANRAHHADVGGRVPGSMPANSHVLSEEGVVISPRPLDERTIDELVVRMRQPDERRADLRAQLAANRIGALRLAALGARLGRERLRAATDAVLDYAERRTRACLTELPDGERAARDVLEAHSGDLELTLRAQVHGDRLTLDFSGSAPQHDGNLNCPLAVTHSACLFAVRVLTDPDIPASAGAYRPIDVIAPAGCLLNAQPDAGPGGVAPAVAAGNVETSSRVADLVLAAFGRALGQGTMNNLTLGDPSSTLDESAFSYYETLGGGQGACPNADGPSGVHVAMSNTLNTPIEALEREFPVRMVRYALRRGSGGEGRFRGGDGVIRELEALSEIAFSLIAERRRHAPPGAAGGGSGAMGRDLLDGVPLPGKATGTLRAGQRLRIETPGGGGFGEGTGEHHAGGGAMSSRDIARPHPQTDRDQEEAPMPAADPIELTRTMYRAYESADRDAVEQLLSEDFVFYSPPDPGIDRARYFERCWPNAGQIRDFDFKRLSAHGDEVVVTYESTKTDGARFRNTEILTFDAGKLAQVEVYFGWDLA